MFEQVRVNWISSTERTVLVTALHHQMTQRLLAAFPGVPVSSMAAELATAAVHEVDALIAKPIQVQAHAVVIKDHRG